MDLTVGQFLFLTGLAFACEFVDSALGMGYGTVLTPALLAMGFDPLIVVPAVVLSQAFGGFSASVFHHRFENADFSRDSKDLRAVFLITSLGIVATVFGALVSINIPKVALKAYIGVLVTIMGILMLLHRTFTYSWKRMVGVGVISAFNKGVSGGGFGPVVTAGQILSGQEHKAAVGVTTLAEAPICICAFFAYVIGKAMKSADVPVLTMSFSDLAHRMFSPQMFNWPLMAALILGSVLVSPLGAFTTSTFRKGALHRVIGILTLALGVYTLLNLKGKGSI